MRQLRTVLFIAQKDLKIFATDRGALIFFILFPFLFIVLFYFLNLGAVEDVRLELHVATQEAPGGISHQIIEAMVTEDDAQLGPGAPLITWERDYNRARKAVEDKAIEGFLAFPADFTQSIMNGESTQIQVVVDSEATDTRAALHGFGKAIASRIGAQVVVIGAVVELQGQPGTAANTEQIIEQFIPSQREMGTEQSFIEINTEEIGEIEAESPANYVIPGYLVMFVFFGAALAAETIVRERQNHTLERMLASSVSREALLGGMFAGIAAKGLIQIAIFWAVGLLAFQMDMGQSPVGVILLSILIVVMSSAFAIMLATLVRTQRSAGSLATLLALVLAPLGGCWWPLFLFPKWMQALAKVTPHGWANTGFNKLMLFGADFGAAVPEMLALLGFAVIFGLIAVGRFRTSAI